MLKTPGPKPTQGAIIGVMLFSLVCLGTLYGHFWPNMNWPDEIFQSVEQAHRFVFGYGLIPWEYREGLRSYLFPGLLAILVWLGQWLGAGSAGYGIIVTMAMVLVSLYPLWGLLTYRAWMIRELLLLFLAVGCWYEILYFAPKAATEIFCANLILGSVLFLFRPGVATTRLGAIIPSLIIGLAGGIRIQYLPAVAIIWLWGWVVLSRRTLALMTAGLLGGLLLTGLIDLPIHGAPFHSLRMNIEKNLLEDIASRWGISPWYYYFSERFNALGWYLVPLMIFSLFGIKPFPVLLAIGLATLLPHLLIGHKEFRFIFLSYWCLMALAAVGSIQIVRLIQGSSWRQLATPAYGILVAFWAISNLRLGLAFPDWFAERDTFLALRALSRDQGICGLATVNIPWHRSGGYYYLHHPVPYLELADIGTLPEEELTYNRLLLAIKHPKKGILLRQAPDRLGIFYRDKCWHHICLYHSDQGCAITEPIPYHR